MAYTAVPTITTGDVATASWGNTYIRDNFAAGIPDIFTADGEVAIGTGANGAEVVAILDSSNRLKHEYGGMEFDASVVTTGDTVVGQSSGVMGLESAMSQAQAEAGTDTQVRGVTAERIKQAILALSAANIATGSYSGDGATSQGITGIGFAPKFVIIVHQASVNTNLQDRELMFTSDTIVDDNASGVAVNFTSSSAGDWQLNTNAIISLDADGFTVDDNGADSHPNANGETYNYIAIG